MNIEIIKIILVFLDVLFWAVIFLPSQARKIAPYIYCAKPKEKIIIVIYLTIPIGASIIFSVMLIAKI